MEHYIQGIITVLSLVNPMICGAMFASATGEQSTVGRFRGATRAMGAVTIILCLTALAGAKLLSLFGISLDAFQVAGGMVLVWMGFLMLRGTPSPTSQDDSNRETPSLTPLILFAASPGTITGVITLAVSHSRHDLPVTALVSVVVALTITWAVMVVIAVMAGKKKEPGGFLHDVTARFMGLIVLAMGFQFALTGLDKFLKA
jgi:multiple antibiotic resistance protein